MRYVRDNLQALLAAIREHMGDLFTATDSVALLDMLSSFADMTALSPLLYTRPEVSEGDPGGAGGPLVIDGGRHPVMSAVQPVHFVENSTFVNSLQNFQVVTGPNGSGECAVSACLWTNHSVCNLFRDKHVCHTCLPVL